MGIKIDPKLQRLIPPLTSEEYAQLEANLLVDGCRDPLVVWKQNGDTILLDGHNRLKICEEHSLTYDTVELELADMDAAKNWMDANQLGRRNLTRELMSLLRGRRYDREKKIVPNPDGIGGKSHKIVKGQNDLQQTTAQKIAAEHGVSEATIKRDGKFAEECEKDPELERVVMTRGDVKKYKKEKQREKRTQTIETRAQETPPPEETRKAFEFPARTYPVIYADPPWRYDYSETDSRKIENQYDTMTVEDICGLPIQTVAAPDAALFLWATSPKLREALRVIDAWGFTYRTCAVWDKQKIGMGYYFRQQHELLLVATRGDMPAPPEKARVSSVISEARGKHSKKPERVYQIIEAMYPDLSKIELFARNKRDGWESWGNQI